MKKIIILVFTFIFFEQINAQVGIGTTTPNSSAALDISDSTKGLLIPRMTMARKQAVVNPTKGLLVYQTNNIRGLWCYNGSAWISLFNTDLFDSTGFVYEVRSSSSEIVAVYTNSNAYAFSNISFPGPTWYPTTLDGTPLGAIAIDKAVMIYTSTSTYAFALGIGWTMQPVTGIPAGISGAGNTMILSTSANLYAYTINDVVQYPWHIQPISGTPLGALSQGGSSLNGPFSCIMVYTTSNAYAFTSSYGEIPAWYSQALSGAVLGSTMAGSKMVVYTSTTAYGFNDAWFSLSLPEPVTGVSP